MKMKLDLNTWKRKSFGRPNMANISIKKKTDKEKGYLEMYQALIPIRCDPKIVDATNRLTSLSDLLPKEGDRSTTEHHKSNRLLVWINKIRVRLAYFIGGKAFEEEVE